MKPIALIDVLRVVCVILTDLMSMREDNRLLLSLYINKYFTLSLTHSLYTHSNIHFAYFVDMEYSLVSTFHRRHIKTVDNDSRCKFTVSGLESHEAFSSCKHRITFYVFSFEKPCF